MKAYDKKSTDALESAAKVLCKTQAERDVLQAAYDMGVSDGVLKVRLQMLIENADKVPA